MIKRVQLQVLPEEAAKEELLINVINSKHGILLSDIKHINILKRSIDARRRNVKINLIIDVYINEKFTPEKRPVFSYQNVSDKEEVIIIGAGPAGLFAALRLIENGKKPIIFERGKDVRARRRDIAILNKEHIVNNDSNYCFGEGGAGTFSDGKLYTRSKKRGDINRILDVLIYHGANPNIKIEKNPHIGTNILPRIISSIRDKIIEHGGKIYFNSRVIDILVKNKRIEGVKLIDGNIIKTKKLVLATGHSARDIYRILYEKGIKIEAKPFALGVRVEHSQQLIDSIQYKTSNRGDYLPPASYSIAKQIKGRGVYSFCMCPGGIIAPCATNALEVVTNGWSPSKRDNPSSNSGIVVEVTLSDIKHYLNKFGSLGAMKFQEDIEQKSCKIAGSTQRVPAQRLVDFTNNIFSSNIPKTSYIPGTTSYMISDLFPFSISNILKEGLIGIGTHMKGFLTNEAVVHAPETRTSSPVRIPRDSSTLEHIQIKGLYPCGEGAGYAGGIVSAAIDGERCAEKC